MKDFYNIDSIIDITFRRRERSEASRKREGRAGNFSGFRNINGLRNSRVEVSKRRAI